MTLRMLAERIEQLTGQINELNRRLTRLVERHAPQLLAPVGMCSDSAVALPMAMGDNPERLSTEASFAALCGVSPIACSSGWRGTRQLNYGGDHRANAALHRVVFTRLRVDPRTPGVLSRRCLEADNATSRTQEPEPPNLPRNPIGLNESGAAAYSRPPLLRDPLEDPGHCRPVYCWAMAARIRWSTRRSCAR
ncbi:transposase [Streptomyces sp. NPDC059701]|uniref:transposase n=2 Tax=Streptomyces TaxID=1883 RepID=UPI003678E07B